MHLRYTSVSASSCRVGKLKRVMALDENDQSGMDDEGLVRS